jgi:hypothetical protein
MTDERLHTVAFTQTFLAHAKAEGMTQPEMDALAQILAADPQAGELIVGSDGCRKLRLAKAGKGKSGGYRVVTYLPGMTRPVYAFAVLAKGSRENFDDAEVAAMVALARKLKAGN